MRLESSDSALLGLRKKTMLVSVNCSCGGDFYDGFPLRGLRVLGSAVVGEHTQDGRTAYRSSQIFGASPCSWTAVSSHLLPSSCSNRTTIVTLFSWRPPASWIVDPFPDCHSPLCCTLTALASQNLPNLAEVVEPRVNTLPPLPQQLSGNGWSSASKHIEFLLNVNSFVLMVITPKKPRWFCGTASIMFCNTQYLGFYRKTESYCVGFAH